MMILNSVFGLVIALGILVTIHEYGHFWVARRFGVKVLRFSIGFGKPFWTKVDRFGTEFAIAWIPLGGYVKMLDEREGEVPEDQLDQAFTQKTPLQKILIALAGPMANFVFAIFAFALMYMIGVRDLVALVDAPVTESPAAVAGIERGDQIIAVDGHNVVTFAELNLAVAARVGDSGTIAVDYLRNGVTRQARLPIEQWLANVQSASPLGELGLLPKIPLHPAVIGQLADDGAAAAGGLQVGDIVIKVDDMEISSWSDWVDAVVVSPELPLTLTVSRQGQAVVLEVTPNRIERDGKSIGYVGAATLPVAWPEDQLVTNRHWPLSALWLGLKDTTQMVSLSYNMLWKMVTGKVSLRQVGGPISMAQMAGASVDSGLEAFVNFLALISISLAIVNLLPVPVLDGGHVVMHSIEAVIRRPISERGQIIGMQLGMAFIISLMLLAFFNDISRLL